MIRITRAYDLAVLWLLSVLATRVVETIYTHGREDGEQDVREWMRRELEAVQAALVTDRMRAYSQGYRDAVRCIDGDEPMAEAPAERVM